MLHVENINQYYGGSHILREVSLTAPLGACTTILGQNGVGKTTLLKVLMGLLPIKSGEITLNEQSIIRHSPEQRLRDGIAYVPQGREIFPMLSVKENLLMGRSRFSGAKARAIPEYLFQLFPILEEMQSRRGGDLSGGQQQQLAIARALCAEPQVLLLDEPTEGIQPSIIKDIGKIIGQLVARGDMAVILVEQFYDFAAELADYYIVMSRGQVVANGAGETMVADGIREMVAI